MMGCKMPWWAGSETPPPDKDKMIADLRAEVASLKEQNSAVTLASAHLINQLAAANGRVEKYREALELIRSVASGEKEIADLMDDTDGLNFVQKVAEAALSALPQQVKSEDAMLLDAIQEGSWDVRSIDLPTGGDDSEIGWRVIEHHMAAPHERVIGESFNDDLRAALRAALSAQD